MISARRQKGSSEAGIGQQRQVAERDRDRLAARQPVDAVHEIEEVDEPQPGEAQEHDARARAAGSAARGRPAAAMPGTARRRRPARSDGRPADSCSRSSIQDSTPSPAKQASSTSMGAASSALPPAARGRASWPPWRCPRPTGTGTLCMLRSLGASRRRDVVMTSVKMPISDQLSAAAAMARSNSE